MTLDFLDDDRCRRIASAARALWIEFLEDYPQYTALSLLDTPPSPEEALHDTGRISQPSFPRNECAEAFCRHCAATMATVSAMVLNQVSLGEWVPSVDGYPISWLVHMEGFSSAQEDDHSIQTTEIKPHAIVLVDLDYLLRFAPNPTRVWTCLLLHEVGHLVLHWDDFPGQRGEDGKAMATARQEAEAWYFESVVMGLAIGFYAHGCVTMPRRSEGDRHEDAWRFLI